MPNVFRRFVLLGFMLSFSGMAFCAGSAEKCAVIAAPVDRLACYDDAFPPIVKGDTAAIEFGMSSKKADKPEPIKLQAKISAFSTMRDGNRLITLDNGQIWRETEKKTMVIIKKDMPVVVRDAAMGTYVLVISGNVALRVKRVK